MKVNQVSEHIWRLKIWVGFPISVWVVVDNEGVTLVDTGIAMMANGIIKFTEQLQAGPLQKILLTHGHPDHVGAVNRILKMAPVSVYAHRIEIPYIQGDLPFPGRKKAKSSIEKGLTKALQEDQFEKDLAEQTKQAIEENHNGLTKQAIEENHNGLTQSCKEIKNLRIQQIGTLTPYHTPGHSPGHVVYYHEHDRVLLAGDLFTSKRGKLHRPMPMFTSNMAEAIRSSSIVRSLQPQCVEVSHGTPVFQAADQLDDYLSKWQ